MAHQVSDQLIDEAGSNREEAAKREGSYSKLRSHIVIHETYAKPKQSVHSATKNKLYAKYTLFKLVISKNVLKPVGLHQNTYKSRCEQRRHY